MIASRNRLAWVDIAKAISIVLVVMMYATYNTGEHTGDVGFLHYAIAFATPFRMPEFFLISGLFLSNVIARSWRQYADRRVLHYLYFYLLWAVIMIVLKVGVFSGNLPAVSTALLSAVLQPYGVLWFVYMLAIFGLVAKLLWQFGIPHWLTLGIAAGLSIAPITSPSYVVTQFAAYYVFFHVGYAFAPKIFEAAEWASKHPAKSVMALCMFFVMNALLVFFPTSELQPTQTIMGWAGFPPITFALAIVGSVALCVLSALLSKAPGTGWLKWLGQRSLVVYVAFTIPMSIARIVLMHIGIVDTGLLSMLVFAAALVSPLVLYAVVQTTSWGQFLIERPLWAQLSKAHHRVIGEPKS